MSEWMRRMKDMAKTVEEECLYGQYADSYNVTRQRQSWHCSKNPEGGK